MDSDLEEAYNTIMEAVCAEDVFGTLVNGQPVTPLESLKKKYVDLTAVIDPELYKSPDDRDMAADAKNRLDTFFERAQSRLEEGIYGMKQPNVSLRKIGHLAFKTAKREYYIGEAFAEGSISTLYLGECAIQDEFAGQAVIKIVNSAVDNELALREARTIKLLHAGNGPQRKHLPVLLDQFLTSDQRVGLILRHIGESRDMYALREQTEYAQGVDRKHMVWMLNRILSAIGYAHNQGVVHCNIDPSHLMVRGRDHNVFVIDWSWSAISPVKTGDEFKVFTEHFSAPEVKKKGSPHPAADIYSVGKCMIYILGGNVETNEMPDTVEKPLQRFLKYLVTESVAQRPHDAWNEWRFLDRLVRDLWGKKKFLVFSTE